MKKIKDKFQVCYEIEDGYVGKSRPQHFNFYASDLEDDFEEENIEMILEECTQTDFENKISWYITNKDEFIEWAIDVIKQMNKKED